MPLLSSCSLPSRLLLKLQTRLGLSRWQKTHAKNRTPAHHGKDVRATMRASPDWEPFQRDHKREQSWSPKWGNLSATRRGEEFAARLKTKNQIIIRWNQTKATWKTTMRSSRKTLNPTWNWILLLLFCCQDLGPDGHHGLQSVASEWQNRYRVLESG